MCSSDLCAPCHTVTPGRTARSRAAVSASYTPSARRATHTAYAAAATAVAQRFVVAAAQRAVVVWLLLLLVAAIIVFGLGFNYYIVNVPVTQHGSKRDRDSDRAVRCRASDRSSARVSGLPAVLLVDLLLGWTEPVGRIMMKLILCSFYAVYTEFMRNLLKNLCKIKK